MLENFKLFLVAWLALGLLLTYLDRRGIEQVLREFPILYASRWVAGAWLLYIVCGPAAWLLWAGRYLRYWVRKHYHRAQLLRLRYKFKRKARRAHSRIAS